MPGPFIERDVAVHGLRLRVRCNDAAVEADLATMLAHLRLAAAPDPAAAPDLCLTVQIEANPPPVPPGAAFVAKADRGIDVWQAGGRLYLHRHPTLAALEPAAGTGTIRLLPAAPGGSARHRTALFDALTLSLLILLRHRGLYMLHAAGLVHGATGFLFIGQSRSGKSTLAFGLVRHGWGYLSDDMVLLRRAADHVEALPLGRDARLTADSLRLFPELDGRQTKPADSDKWHLDVEALYPHRCAAGCVPRVLIFPEITPDAESRLMPLGGTQALLRLIEQTTLVSPAPDLAARQLGVLKRLVGQAPAYRLLAGQDVGRDPSRASALLAPLAAVLPEA